ncbi:MAG TPA: OsmC family protein [Bacillales bacterium]|nr:OsmC family protein [Bacillales bacterium]
MTRHVFECEATWKGGRRGIGEMRAGNLTSSMSVPASMGGAGQGTNPDELLLSAAASCFLMTFGIGLEAAGIEVQRVSIHSKGTVSEQGGLHFETVLHHLDVKLPDSADKTDIEKVQEIVKRSESRCMVSKALKGNVEILVEAEIA